VYSHIERKQRKDKGPRKLYDVGEKKKERLVKLAGRGLPWQLKRQNSNKHREKRRPKGEENASNLRKEKRMWNKGGHACLGTWTIREQGHAAARL